MSRDPQKDRGFFGHPRGLSTLFFTEMWERFSYYGMRPMLVALHDRRAAQGGFRLRRERRRRRSSASTRRRVYLASLPGGWIADRSLGLRRAILYGAVLISLGHISIASLGVRAWPSDVLPRAHLHRARHWSSQAEHLGDRRRSLSRRRRTTRRGLFDLLHGHQLSARSSARSSPAPLGEAIGWHWGFGAAGVGMLARLDHLRHPRAENARQSGHRRHAHPDPVAQAREVGRAKSSSRSASRSLVIVVGLAATGVITIDPKAVASNMTFVLVGPRGALLRLHLLGGRPVDRREEARRS